MFPFLVHGVQPGDFGILAATGTETTGGNELTGWYEPEPIGNYLYGKVPGLAPATQAWVADFNQPTVPGLYTYLPTDFTAGSYYIAMDRAAEVPRVVGSIADLTFTDSTNSITGYWGQFSIDPLEPLEDGKIYDYYITRLPTGILGSGIFALRCGQLTGGDFGYDSTDAWTAVIDGTFFGFPVDSFRFTGGSMSLVVVGDSTTAFPGPGTLNFKNSPNVLNLGGVYDSSGTMNMAAGVFAAGFTTYPLTIGVSLPAAELGADSTMVLLWV